MLSIDDFDLPKDLERYRLALREFIANEGQQLTEEVERLNHVPERAWEAFRKAGLFKLTIPKAYGGFELTPTQYAPLLEEIAHAHGSLRLLLHLFNWGSSQPLVLHGTEDQKQRMLAPMAEGRNMVIFALTEPEGGTGKDLRTEARLEGDTWILNGRKHLISFANVGKWFQVIAVTDREDIANGFTLFMVDRHAPGFTITPMADGMGMHGGYHGVLDLKDTPVPAADVLGPPGRGLDIALEMLDMSRGWIAMSCVGLAQEMFDRSVRYAKERLTFGKPIAQRQAIQGLIANMDTYISAGRALVMELARRGEAGEDIRALAAKCKLFGIEMSRIVSDAALEIHGGVGYLEELPIARMYRDIRAMWFEEGAPTIQRLVIARSALDLR
jgi:alkylation response protein AidB-like acyl-CoA dehydrogenase